MMRPHRHLSQVIAGLFDAVQAKGGAKKVDVLSSFKRQVFNVHLTGGRVLDGDAVHAIYRLILPEARLPTWSQRATKITGSCPEFEAYASAFCLLLAQIAPWDPKQRGGRSGPPVWPRATLTSVFPRRSSTNNGRRTA